MRRGRGSNDGSLTVHLIEPGGRGGVYQHALAVAEGLARQGVPVVLHTSEDCEVAASIPVQTCRCVCWHRGMKSTWLRRIAITARYLLTTLPHLWRRVTPDDVAHFQGWFKGPLTWITLEMLRRRGARTILSPHNTFSRGGHSTDLRILRRSARMVDCVVVYSASDGEVVRGWGVIDWVVAPLVVPMPVHPELVDEWRDRWGVGPNRHVVLFAGQLRKDKRLDLAIETARICGPEWVLAVVGEDKGEAESCMRLAERGEVHVHWTVGYLSLPEFVSAVAAADVVLCPYDQASQSAVAVLAAQLGVATVVRDVGGLSEIATRVVVGPDPRQLAAAVAEVFLEPRPARKYDRVMAMVDQMLAAYRVPARK